MINRQRCVRPFALFLALCGFASTLGLTWIMSIQPGQASSQQMGSKSSKKQPPVKKKQSRRAASKRFTQRLKKLEMLFVPPNGSAPKSTANSATRSSLKCLPGEAAIEAWSPPSGHGLSRLARPAITLSLPSTSAQRVALLFRGESGEVTQQAFLPIPPASADLAEAESLTLSPDHQTPNQVVQFQLPPSQPGLLPGQLYQWSLVVVCGDSVEPDDPTFMGWVEYREPTLQEAKATSSLSPQEKLRWYAQRGYWYDLVKE